MATTVKLIPEQMQKGENKDIYVTRLTLNGKVHYSCNFCKRICKTYAECIGHTRSHTGEKPFSCFYCKKPFSLKSDVTVHERIHTGEKPFACGVCGLAFLSTSKLIGHRKQKKYIACSTSVSIGKLSNYRLTTNSNSSPEQHRQITTENTSNVESVICQPGYRPYACKNVNCKKACRTKTKLKIHERTHLGGKRYYCPICKKEYSSESGFRYHLKHSKRSKCANVILQAGSVDVQVQTSPFEAVSSLCTLNSAPNTNVTRGKVDGKVFYFCGFCKKKFQRRSKAVCHERIHTGVKPFSCTYSNCNKSFSQLGSLHRHEKTHSREKS